MDNAAPSQPDDGITVPRVLYHCIPWAPQGEAIRTSDNYGTEIPVHIREQLGIADDHPPLLFAATHLSKALAFGIPKGQGLFNTSIPGSEGELYLLTNRNELLQKQLDATVYAFSGEGFARLPQDRQCISTEPMPFDRAVPVVKARNVQDLMRAGLQILTFRETLDELRHGDRTLDVIDTMKKERGKQGTMELVASLVREGRVIWENQAANINPDPVLAKILGVSLQPSTGPNPVAPKR